MKCDALTIILGLVVPLILTLIFILPEDIKESYFVLNPSSPTLQTMFLSNYTHLEFWHFFNNLLAYFITILIILYIETDRKMLFIMSILLFIFLPFISSLATIEWRHSGISKGFSAIAAGFLGYLLYATYGYVKSSLNINLSPYFLIALFSINIAAYEFNGGDVFLGFLCTILPLLFLIWFEKEAIKNLMEKIHLRLNTKRQETLKLIMLLIFIISWVTILFSNILIYKVENGTEINVIVHYLGYCFGLFMPIILGSDSLFEDIKILWRAIKRSYVFILFYIVIGVLSGFILERSLFINVLGGLIVSVSIIVLTNWQDEKKSFEANKQIYVMLYELSETFSQKFNLLTGYDPILDKDKSLLKKFPQKKLDKWDEAKISEFNKMLEELNFFVYDIISICPDNTKIELTKALLPSLRQYAVWGNLGKKERKSLFSRIDLFVLMVREINEIAKKGRKFYSIKI